MSDSDLPPDSHSTPQENQDGSEQAASEVQENPSPAAEDSDLNMDRDSNDGGASDNESELSDVDEAAFADFDPNSVALAERPQAIDEEITKGLKARKIKRTDGESKKKEAKRDKSKKKRAREEDDNASGGEEIEGKRSRKPKRAAASGRTSRTDEERARAQKQKDAIAEESMTPEQRRSRALDAVMDAALKNPNKRRRKKDEVDLEEAFDDEIAAVKIRMEEACRDDNTARESGQPAIHKLSMLPEVVALLNRNTVQHSIVDPDTNFLQSVRFFLEPLNDGSLPAYNIQRDIFAALGKLPIEKDALLASGIGKVVQYYTKSKRPELAIKRQAEKLLGDWMRPILKRSDDYKMRRVEEIALHKIPDRTGSSSQQSSSQNATQRSRAQTQRDLERARLLAPVPMSNRARLEGATVASYSIAPRADPDAPPKVELRQKPIGAGGTEQFRRMVAKKAKR